MRRYLIGRWRLAEGREGGSLLGDGRLDGRRGLWRRRRRLIHFAGHGDFDGHGAALDVEHDFFQLGFVHIFDPSLAPSIFHGNREGVLGHGNGEDFIAKHVGVGGIVLVYEVKDPVP